MELIDKTDGWVKIVLFNLGAADSNAKGSQRKWSAITKATISFIVLNVNTPIQMEIVFKECLAYGFHLMWK